ncbi:MAG TPA: hypothetical protein VK524_25405 [Polyangiaceae bacterium]|nr:hypothetical protein [Polyangiaceae bacterium]
MLVMGGGFAAVAVVSSSKAAGGIDQRSGAVAEAPAPETQRFVERVSQEGSFNEAVRAARPRMRDTFDEGPTLAAYAVANWLHEKGVLADVDVSPEETSTRFAKKDIEVARGKRACFVGNVAHIARNPFYPQSFDATLSSEDWDAVNAVAARNTGALVEGMRARFCGVVTGVVTYVAASGGRASVVQLAGMFDLPENRNR